YGTSNELLSLNGQSYTYNTLLQLTRITASGMDLQYRYSATQNNGKITSQYDAISGEEVTYAYDSLNRLASAQTSWSDCNDSAHPAWGQSYAYDGFGNLTDQNVTRCSAPEMHVTYSASTNRQTGDVADANGNIGYYLYDVENRITSNSPGLASFQYSYAPG